jgi:transcriptional regulator with XRE-family HTH domain
MAGLTSPAVLQIEAGKRKNPPYSTLAALAEALDVTIDGLAGRSRRGKRNPLRDKDIGVVVHKMTRMSTEMRALVREYVDTLREKGQTPV